MAGSAAGPVHNAWYDCWAACRADREPDAGTIVVVVDEVVVEVVVVVDCCASVSVASATERAASSAETASDADTDGVMVAIVWPVATVSPTVTSTDAMVPVMGGTTVVLFVGCRVPIPEIVAVTTS